MSFRIPFLKAFSDIFLGAELTLTFLTFANWSKSSQVTSLTRIFAPGIAILMTGLTAILGEYFVGRFLNLAGLVASLMIFSLFAA
jgi:hypothetical protein